MRELTGLYNPIELEPKIQTWWRVNGIQEKVEMLRQGSKIFSFLEGPPTANGFMHAGHARGRAIKDAILRFYTMKGFNVWRRAGWDCQGLPVEIEVEKKLKLASKRDIEKVGVENFVKECNLLVDFYLSYWRENSEKLALWLNYDEAYETRKDEYIEFVWWTIKKAYEKKLLKEDLKVVPTCPRCETPLSSHEVAQGYEIVKDPSIYVKFKLIGKNNEYILIWTTTPWTIPGNEAVSIHPDYEYAWVKVGSEKWILAKELVKRVMNTLKVDDYQIGEPVKGKELEGIKYEHPLLNEVPIHHQHKGKYEHSIICGEHVTLEEGTGCVHTAPGHGPEDFEIGKKYGLTVFCPVDQVGCFTSEAGKYAKQFVKNADSEIVADLRNKGLLVMYGEIEHEYPLCWRCGAPLIYRVDKQWFITVGSIRERLVEENEKINWVPKWAGENRFGEWIANAEDWCISRSRIWGTPLNVWRCQNCGDIKVIETIEELKKSAKKLPLHFELHRPWIDEVVLECERCRKEMKRVPQVLDVWLDSGVAHSASINFLKDRSLFDMLYPYDFITEGVDQTRGWFYSLLTTGVILFGKAPYKRVLCQGLVLDKFGQKMSKSRGNVIWTHEVLKKYGADLLRTYLLWKAAPEDALAFDYEEIEQVKRGLTILWNIFAFSITYMLLDNFKPEEGQTEKFLEYLKEEDKWIISKSQTVIKEMTDYIENLRPHKAIRSLLNFIVDDVSRFYIRLIRRRTWIEAKEMDKTAAYVTLYEVLLTITKLMAPFAPHLAEELYQHLAEEGKESVHMCDWPIFKEYFVNEKLEKEMEICRETVKASLAARQKKQIKLRWPVKKLIIIPFTIEVMEALKNQKDILANQVNAKEVAIGKPNEKPYFMQIIVEPNYNAIGPKFKSKTAQIVSQLKKMDINKILNQLSEKGEIEVALDEKIFKLAKEDILIKEIIPEHISFQEFAYGRVYVDVTKTPELLAEAFGKEVVRRAQIMRKELQLKIEEYINMVIQPEEKDTLELITKMKDYIISEVRVKSFRVLNPQEKLELNPKAYLKEWDIEEERLKICIEKLD
jgi:isoleucyl-tRNA synthetase